MKIYLLCGLGADERLFSYLDLSPFEVVPVHWVTPLPRESFERYVQRLVPQITDQRPVLMGVSFGGMVAVELGKLIETEKIILISSAATANELPFLYRIAGRLRIHRLFPAWFFKNSHRFMNWIMGAVDPVRRDLLADMLKKTDEQFLSWAIDMIVTWRNTIVPSTVIRIHGSADRVLPMRKADYVIMDGSHLIVANRPREVDGYIRTILGTSSRDL